MDDTAVVPDDEVSDRPRVPVHTRRSSRSVEQAVEEGASVRIRLPDDLGGGRSENEGLAA
jgi:hypothetical protein